ncbi:Alpha/Beta hydrolase fold [Phytophthora cactorum]|nr:Alpha/Beta hydrolase fold [Phytophthora cactorum]
MQLHHVLLVAAIAVQLSSAFQTASKTSKLNGWFDALNASSTSLEVLMCRALSVLRTANVYTMDHRGSGRSTFLDCTAAQSITNGSPRGKEIEPSEVPSCAKVMERKYGDLAAFSPTSAAKDLITLMSEFSNGENTIVYGMDLGTIYVLQLDRDLGEVANAFMDLCTQDRGCSSHFKKPHTLASTLRKLLVDLDNNPNSACADILANPLIAGINEESASYSLRVSLAALLTDSQMWSTIPPLISRLKRCRPNDVEVVKIFFDTVAQQADTSNPLDSGVLKYKFGNYDAPGIIYKHDKYWNARIAIPDQASVLLVSSKMDTQTPHKYAESFLKSLKGDNKELITFDYSVHGALTSTLLETEVPEIETCGVKLLASYVSSGGDLDSLDKSCLDEMPEFNLTLNDFHKIMLGGVDAYDGTFELSPGRY